MTLGGASFDLWQLPEWWVDSRTVLHLVLAARDHQPAPRESHRQLLAALHVERGGAQVPPVWTGTYSGDRLIQRRRSSAGKSPG